MMEDEKKIKGILIHSTNSVKLSQCSDFQCLFSIVDKCKCEWTEWNRWNQEKRRKRTSTSIEWNRNNFRFLLVFFVFYNTLPCSQCTAHHCNAHHPNASHLSFSHLEMLLCRFSLPFPLLLISSLHGLVSLVISTFFSSFFYITSHNIPFRTY